MDKREAIISDAEVNYDVSLADADLSGILCNDIGCRSDECDCWEQFEDWCNQKASNIVMRGMKKLYDGEVTAGFHRPKEL